MRRFLTWAAAAFMLPLVAAPVSASSHCQIVIPQGFGDRR
jgi:hypothetical protein